jgi:NADPH-dependent curcumin reductase CurA
VLSQTTIRIKDLAKKNWSRIIVQRLNIKGFIVSDYLGDRNVVKLLEWLSDAAHSEMIEIDSKSEIVFNMKFEDIPNTPVKNVG